mmetsp:Transcript_73494/g.163246  ORF Transcript_73494/g.163246 Transcript_73494/m.163246 type:complete len:152 (+) Transcript_73494:27-482(+)
MMVYTRSLLVAIPKPSFLRLPRAGAVSMCGCLVQRRQPLHALSALSAGSPPVGLLKTQTPGFSLGPVASLQQLMGLGPRDHSHSSLHFPSIIQRALLSPLLPMLLLMTGKSKASGKNKRKLHKANHGARPCNHVGRYARKLKRVGYKNPKR